ncbi:MAG: oxygen-independent coproporphyrinogen III oxidase [Lachnospiraceae bacterium]|nr:oxygen-independent coproporphyrinogen III oxidase [Lachnospiraceae bacterium]
MADKKELELYFHIPFCVRKCAYCDFLSAPAGKPVQEAYMKAMLAELSGRADECRDHRVSSVFIGGGTPSVVEETWICQLMQRVKESFALASDAEITIEVNPGTVTEKKLKVYRQAGINRLSIGLQSARDEELKKLGRVHTYEQFLETYCAARAAGFANINVDVMSALPGQSLLNYEETLKKVLALSPIPEHISAYSLIIEEGTPFFESYGRGELQLPDEDCERRMYERTAELLGEAGFVRYEISNYARPGFFCRHNCGYWKRTEYLGFGIGAASLFQNSRFSNSRELSAYLKEPLGSREDRTVLSPQDRMEEFMFLGLRMTAGVNYREFAETFGQTMEEVYGGIIQKNRETGLLYDRKDPETGERFLALTGRGVNVSNYVMAQFLFD